MILGCITGGMLQSSFKITMKQFSLKWIRVIKLIYLMLFGVMGFSLVPVLLHFFLDMQIRIGNKDLALIVWLADNETQAVFGVWGLFALGLVIALPAAFNSDLLK